MASASQGEPWTAVGEVLFDREGWVLLVRRARPPGAGTWSLPPSDLPSVTVTAAVARVGDPRPD